jgi:predicted dithiol-disulfide oxidoreductase (DUF899 family)
MLAVSALTRRSPPGVLEFTRLRNAADTGDEERRSQLIVYHFMFDVTAWA